MRWWKKPVSFGFLWRGRLARACLNSQMRGRDAHATKRRIIPFNHLLQARPRLQGVKKLAVEQNLVLGFLCLRLPQVLFPLRDLWIGQEARFSLAVQVREDRLPLARST